MVVGVALFSVLVSAIAFFGRPPHTPVIFKDQLMVYGYNAPFAFQFESELQRKILREEARARVNPVYKVDEAVVVQSVKLCESFAEKISEKFDELKKETNKNARYKIVLGIFEDKNLSDSVVVAGGFGKTIENVLQLVDACSTREQFDALATVCVSKFKEIASRGLYDPKTDFNVPDVANCLAVGEFREEFRNKLWDSLLKINISDVNRVNNIVSDLFSPLARTSVRYDAEGTRERQEKAEADVPPVVVSVREGAPLLTSGERVDDATLERWLAYRNCLRPDISNEHFQPRFFVDLLCVLCIAAAAWIYRRILIPLSGKPMERRLRFAGVMVVLNVALIRGVLEMSESATVVQLLGSHGDSLVWLSSPAAAAVAVSAIAGAPLGVLAAFFTSAVAALMLGGNIQILLMFAVSSLVAVVVSRNATKRSRLVRAGVYSGVAMALTAILSGYYGEALKPESFTQIVGNSVVAVLAGFFYGIISTGLLSVLEGVFRVRSNISLIELANYDHPLLTKMQIAAPGTFNHCLTVANYADAAAREVGANAALCRCAALFHDIGKIQKAAFFTENQGSERNPHDGLTPQNSALIIKNHVREGVALAEEWNLPERVRDIIAQHHGTSLVGYFFKKAKDLAVENGSDPAASVVEKQFRYDGPKPQTIEAAIVMMCDIVEAASRSRRMSQSVKELVAKLIGDRLREGEFDECPITLAQISAIQESLVKSVNAAGHTRISYQKEDAAPVPNSAPVPALTAPAEEASVAQKNASAADVPEVKKQP